MISQTPYKRTIGQRQNQEALKTGKGKKMDSLRTFRGTQPYEHFEFRPMYPISDF